MKLVKGNDSVTCCEPFETRRATRNLLCNIGLAARDTLATILALHIADARQRARDSASAKRFHASVRSCIYVDTRIIQRADAVRTG